MPSDIANWLGTWWMPLFKNFSFNDQAPYGDFSISGIWGGEPGNSQTYGSVIAKDLTYRNCHINDAQVVVLVEENSTELRAPHISHTLGSLSGSLLFPHNRLNSSMLLEFQVSGDFPFNDARKALGPTIENSFSERCVKDMLVSGMGTPLYTFSDKMSRPLGIKSAPLRTIFPDAWEESRMLFSLLF